MKGDDISERFLDFGVRVMRLVQAWPRNFVGRHVGSQLIRCGTLTGANYEEARGAESKADFIHKLGISWKEIRESWYWLRLIHQASLVKPSRVEALVQESNEPSAILAESLQTARQKDTRPES